MTATTSDGVYISMPRNFESYVQLLRPAVAPIGIDDHVTDLTSARICQVLRLHPPKSGCTRSNYPASPGIPSASGAAWAGNGCGASPLSSAFASIALSVLYRDRYSGDLDKPVKGDPSIDFTDSCNMHDSAYTGPLLKSTADRIFQSSLEGACLGAPGNRSECYAFAQAYVDAVETSMGSSAYEEDQQQLACSVWGTSLKQSGCI